VRAAARLLAALVTLGVRDVVLAPGSRSAPLAYAASALADGGRIGLHVRVDERDAGFLALGLSRGAALPGATPRGSALAGGSVPADDRFAPVAVVTTSGTAVANLHPAVLEAHHAGVPLLLLTADRPHELRGTGANQTTDQPGIFGSAVRLVVDVPAPDGRPGEGDDLDHVAARAVDAAVGTRSSRPGPVQLNLAYRDPLVPHDLADSVVAASRPPTVVRALAAAPELPSAFAARVRRTVVVAGDGAGRLARDLAEAQGWPLLAEPSSGACGGPNLVPVHRIVLGSLGGDVARAVVLGRPTLSRPVQTLLARAEVVVVDPTGAPWVDAARHAALVLPEVPDVWREPPVSGSSDADAADAAWLERWRSAGAAARAVVTTGLVTTGLVTADVGPSALGGLDVAAALAAASGPDDVLVVGSSSPVRDLDLVAAWDEPPSVVANRGLAGIDGLVSTAIGVALAVARARRGRVRAYLGDLTFLHDAGGLLAVRGEQRPDLQVVVANDRGGSIFSTLEPGGRATSGPAASAVFERVFGTPHDVDLGALCQAYGVAHVRVDDAQALADVLDVPPRGLQVVEVVTDRGGRRDRERLLGERVRAVLER
jgi:2-succinyl-5-enolpyruvyl-6-hydroxy-3-cyclohexene-1-carboxylate synthase